MLVLVDAYNAMYRLWAEAPHDRDEARRRLVEACQEAVRSGRPVPARAHVTLVFDTHPGASRQGQRSRSGNVRWVYVAGSADDAIVARVKEDGGTPGRSVVVVTDDRELAGRTRQLGARVLGVRAFFAPGDPRVDCPPPPAGGPALGAGDFGLPDGEIDLSSGDPDAF